MFRTLFVMVLFGALIACGKGDQARVPVQIWDNVKFKIETHPYPVRPGHNEIWLMARQLEGGPASNLIIYLRANEERDWVQSVQDGHIGVFRRSVEVADGDRYLYVRLQRGKKHTKLKFELPWENVE